MTKSNIGKVFIGMVLLAGSARAGQWQFAHESTIVPAGPDEAAFGVQSLRVHSPVGLRGTSGAEATTVRVEILNAEQQVVGELIDTKSAAVSRERGAAPEQVIELSFQGRHVSVHYKDRAIWVSDGASSASASFDRTNAEDSERLRAFADDLRLIGGIQLAAKAATTRATTVAPTTRADVLGISAIAGVWSSWFGRSDARMDEVVCHTEPSKAQCGGGFAASRSAGCAYAQQEAHNECAAASGYCIGCCAWVGSGCDCSCLLGDLACMCESCGGTCGPSMSPSAPVAPSKQ